VRELIASGTVVARGGLVSALRVCGVESGRGCERAVPRREIHARHDHLADTRSARSSDARLSSNEIGPRQNARWQSPAARARARGRR
jgi:hypothetical protein